MSVWQGRIDAAEGERALRWHQCVRAHAPAAQPGVALLGFACDEGVRRNQGRIGAAAGPRVLRQALANLAWHGRRAVYDAGDVSCPGEDLEAAQAELAARVAGLLDEGHLPLLLGGGHETAWGSFQGLVRGRPQARIGVLNLDAHFDLRHAERPSSGTPFAQIADWQHARGQAFRYLCLGIAEPANSAALFDRAEALGAGWCLDEDIDAARLPALLERVEAFCAGVDAVQLSIDLDVLPAAVMPAVSAPAARGVALEHLEAILDRVKASGRLALAEVVEFNPRFDIDNQGARSAARLLWRLAR
ncbi:formimidoylglutamase [Pseudomonas sp. RIT-PI-AD]|uniref:formimidoylglutamase n=1 Tax=Pseudomonas sp. RIT-PI-AD TaxID=3035294 RepID=UPI003207A82F